MLYGNIRMCDFELALRFGIFMVKCTKARMFNMIISSIYCGIYSLKRIAPPMPALFYQCLNIEIPVNPIGGLLQFLVIGQVNFFTCNLNSIFVLKFISKLSRFSLAKPVKRDLNPRFAHSCAIAFPSPKLAPL
jgi:hypothetical protein